MRKREWRDRIASLHRKAKHGDVASMAELGLDLLEGIQDRNGRAIVRRDPRAAFRLLHLAAERGEIGSAFTVGYAYDRGLGTRRSTRLALLWYHRAARRGSSSAATNTATVHRDAGKLSLAFRWWKRSADMDDGDAAVNVAYCYQYGIGVRRDRVRARRMLRRAIKSKNITDYGREEAMYLLALGLIDSGKTTLAMPLLTRASRDGDYPEASEVSAQIRRKADITPCRCRRHIYKHLHGHAHCHQHPDRRR